MASKLQVDPGAGNVSGPEGADKAVTDPETDAEASALEENSDSAVEPDDGQPWCPPLPETMEDPTEEELARAAEKLETMVEQLRTTLSFFFTPTNFGAADPAKGMAIAR